MQMAPVFNEWLKVTDLRESALFSNLIIVGYYDGPTEGVIGFSNDVSVWFKLISRSKDGKRQKFVLYSMEDNCVEKFLSAATLDNTKSVVAVFLNPGDKKTEIALDELERAVLAPLAITHGSDILICDEIKFIDEDEHSFWFKFLYEAEPELEL